MTLTTGAFALFKCRFLNYTPYVPNIAVFIASVACFSSLQGISPEQIEKRVHSHLLVGDCPSACREGALGLQQHPYSKQVWQTYLRALTRAGDEKGMMLAWRTYTAMFPDEQDNREILECLAWAVLNQGFSSSSPLIRAIAMLGAFLSQDAKGIAILQQGMLDSNSFLRAAAVKLSSHLLDVSLQDELLRLLRTEKVWKVRLEVINAVGALQMVEARKELRKVIADEHCHADEKAAAIKSLVLLSEGANEEQLSQLVASNRVGMRMLACKLVAHFEQKNSIDRLFPLLCDPHSSVRAEVLLTLGRLRVASIGGQLVNAVAAKAAFDPDPVVGVAAAWTLTINDPKQGMAVFEKFFDHPLREIRYLAAAALASTGKYGMPLTTRAFMENRDPYVRMNLAIGLIGQRVNVRGACDCLFSGLARQKERWAWSEENQFRVLAPSKVKHDDAIPNYPEAVNQLTRLEVLQILSIAHYPYAQAAIKNFLQESNWGISGLASALLLTEGDDHAVDLVQTLLKDNDPKVKIQAALILALWGKGEDVVQLLQEAYDDADKDMKGQILEGIGHVGSRASLSFLAERLQEPYQRLRIISAAALLECLYH